MVKTLLDIETLDFAPTGLRSKPASDGDRDIAAHIHLHVNDRMVNMKFMVPQAINRSLMYKLLREVT